MRATAIIPIKRFRAAKQRLVEAVGPQGRAALAKAMLADALEQTTQAELIDRVIVVTGEGRAEKVAMHRAQRAKTPIEVFRDPGDAGHSEAATLGIIRAMALGAEAVALLPGDCPLLAAAELDAALGRLAPDSVSVVPDRHGTGTNALLLAPPDAIGPAFGPESCARHVERAHRRGLEAMVDQVPSLALDLDTAEDLEVLASELAAEPRRAPRTAAALAELPAGP
ncbi:MAG: 2-phospho-L-lactate guanylyltransferase [Solirubrobacterales bacterium]